ncbi:hypothetical protein M407DRAFT_26479 [Tulasnella calospora MUT 4182]|uniref:CFEM domain-containing protein n=1 Tax=Tulasnella calospora MUT 4182 TaxID=1051891 RepID=A0A0C3KRP7_9AGAM|nr:hypothetical protein M407DRAFT_26479 [Tulasnella calospora MUT 4182]
MRFSITTVLFAASLASAYTIAKRQTTVPAVSTWFVHVTACAQTCNANTNPAPCTTDDNACECVNVNYITVFKQCIATSCTAPGDAQAAQAAIEAVCQAAGIDVNNPFPACMVTCNQNTVSSTCTDPSNGACYCNDTAWIQAVDTCYQSSCQGQDLTSAQTANAAGCRAFGVDISA